LVCGRLGDAGLRRVLEFIDFLLQSFNLGLLILILLLQRLDVLITKFSKVVFKSGASGL